MGRRTCGTPGRGRTKHPGTACMGFVGDAPCAAKASVTDLPAAVCEDSEAPPRAFDLSPPDSP